VRVFFPFLNWEWLPFVGRSRAWNGLLEDGRIRFSVAAALRSLQRAVPSSPPPLAATLRSLQRAIPSSTSQSLQR